MNVEEPACNIDISSGSSCFQQKIQGLLVEWCIVGVTLIASCSRGKSGAKFFILSFALDMYFFRNIDVK